MQTGIEDLSEAELIRKLQVAAQVCTFSVAQKLQKQPRQQFYPHPPSISQASGASLASQPLLDAAATLISQSSAAVAAAAAASTTQAGEEAEKTPFRKGKWLGGRQVEGMMNRGGKQPVNDGPAASREARARGYQRMRTPSQVRFCSTHIEGPSPTCWIRLNWSRSGI